MAPDVSAPCLHTPDDPQAARVYRAALWHLRERGLPFLVGGTYALEYHADIVRDTKDLDLFVRRADWSRVQDALAAAEFDVTLTYSHWLGKARHEEWSIDLIFAGGNALVEVDDGWLSRGIPAVILDVPVHLVSAEDMIWSKSFVMERERFDGADVVHILRKSGQSLDWSRLIARYGSHAPVLLAHLILFQYVYPGHRDQVPAWVMQTLTDLAARPLPFAESLCRGTLISREQYLIDVHEWGYRDARELPLGRMTPQQLKEWTDAIDQSD